MTSHNQPQPASSSSSCLVLLFFLLTTYNFFYNMYLAIYSSPLLICSLVLTIFEEIGLTAVVVIEASAAGHDDTNRLGTTTDDSASALEGPTPLVAEPKLYNYNYKLPRIRHIRGKYKHKEEIIKKVEHDHPCKLTETAVKVTFPGMKEEVLVSFLGYKEPNLMPVLRCKGLCNNQALSPVACVPTKLRYKKVKMAIKTQYLQQNGPPTNKVRELVLEEHEECGCRCLNVRPEHCMEPSLFNNETCSCKCDTSLYNRDQIRCETFNDRTWDPVTCTCRRTEEGILLAGPKQQKDAIAAGIDDFLPGQSGRHHHHKTMKRPGHDVEPAIVECNDPSHQHNIAVMPKSGSFGFGSTNSWTAIGVCTFLVIVFACTTLYYWQKAQKMSKDLFTDNEANEEDDNDVDDDLVPTPPPKPLSKKPCSLEDISSDMETASPKKQDLLLNSTLLKSNSTILKSPMVVDMVPNKCDSSKKIHHSGDKVHPNEVKALLTNNKVHPNEVTKALMTNGVIKNSNADLKPKSSPSEDDDDDENNDHANAEVQANETSIMNLLLAAAAKSQKQPNGMAKAASMSELEASTSQSLQKDPEIQQALANHGDDDDDDGPDPHHYHHHHHHHHHQQMHQAVQQQSPPHQPLQPHSGRPLQQQQQQRCHNQPQQSQRHKSSNLSVNRSSEVVTTHVHQAKVHELEVVETSDFRGPLCMECVHASLLRHPRHPRPRHHLTPNSSANRQLLRQQHSFHHPHNTSNQNYHHQSMERRPRRPPVRQRRLHHGSYGQLLDDEDLLQQCLATLVMDAAILRQQQQLQQEQLKLQQEQIQQQQNVINNQVGVQPLVNPNITTTHRGQKENQQQFMKEKVNVKLVPQSEDPSPVVEVPQSTADQSVIESIAGDNTTNGMAATVLTVDHFEVAVETEETAVQVETIRTVNGGHHHPDVDHGAGAVHHHLDGNHPPPPRQQQQQRLHRSATPRLPLPASPNDLQADPSPTSGPSPTSPPC